MANLESPDKPPRVQTRILAAPKIRQVYWCDFWRDAHLPEMWKTRPVVVVSYRNKLHSPCTVIPLSTVVHDPKDAWAYKLDFQIDGVTSWAVCNMPSTVAPSRFSQFKGRIPLLPETDFNEILARLLKWLPRPFFIAK
jgi:mRNA interferase MazF